MKTRQKKEKKVSKLMQMARAHEVLFRAVDDVRNQLEEDTTTRSLDQRCIEEDRDELTAIAAARFSCLEHFFVLCGGMKDWRPFSDDEILHQEMEYTPYDRRKTLMMFRNEFIKQVNTVRRIINKPEIERTKV